jgi:hypothetical protein
MTTFKDSLKKWFYNTGSNELASGVRVCLLDASGNPIGSDTIEHVAAFVFTKDEYVDMDLPSGTLWAKRNIGATSETDYGWFFSWGNLNAHPKGSGYDFSQAVYDNTPGSEISGNLSLSQDAARANLGLSWRMPTTEEFAELFNASYTEYITASGTVISGTDKRTTYNGVTGLLLRSKSNGNKLFFPAAGYYDGTTLDGEGSNGYSWSSSFVSATNARYLSFGSGGVYPQNNNVRRLGFSVRAVQ